MSVSSHAQCMDISMIFHRAAVYLVITAVSSVLGSYLPNVFPARIKHILGPIHLASLVMYLAMTALDHWNLIARIS